jgi:hypothetical protein
MKRIYFFNDWYARAPWYVRILMLLPVILIFGSRFIENAITTSLVFRLLFLVLVVAFYALLLFQARCKNAFIYQSREHFGIRLNGKLMNIDPKFISEVSFDDNHQLQIRRINRVDTFDLSPFRKQDQEKLLRLLKDFMSEDMQINKQSILSSVETAR